MIASFTRLQAVVPHQLYSHFLRFYIAHISCTLYILYVYIIGTPHHSQDTIYHTMQMLGVDAAEAEHALVVRDEIERLASLKVDTITAIHMLIKKVEKLDSSKVKLDYGSFVYTSVPSNVSASSIPTNGSATSKLQSSRNNLSSSVGSFEESNSNSLLLRKRVCDSSTDLNEEESKRRKKDNVITSNNIAKDLNVAGSGSISSAANVHSNKRSWDDDGMLDTSTSDESAVKKQRLNM